MKCTNILTKGGGFSKEYEDECGEEMKEIGKVVSDLDYKREWNKMICDMSTLYQCLICKSIVLN